MLYLVSTFNEQIRQAMRNGHIGQLITPDAVHRLELGVPWAADNGCFSSKWQLHKWLSFLDRHAGLPDCLFAVVPDVVGDHSGTVERFYEWGPAVRERGFPVAFVGQNGATIDNTPWDEFDAWFAGGTTEWKLGAAWDIHAEAKRQGKWTHMGRVNSQSRLRAAAAAGYDSADGTYLAFGPDKNLKNVLKWVQKQRSQPSLLTERTV